MPQTPLLGADPRGSSQENPSLARSTSYEEELPGDLWRGFWQRLNRSKWMRQIKPKPDNVRGHRKPV